MTPQEPKVFLNLADEEVIAGLPGLTPEEARALSRARPFRDWSDVRRMDGFDSDRVADLKSRGVALGEPSAGPIGEPGSGGSGGSPAGNLGRA
jgi:hypothetical protein